MALIFYDTFTTDADIELQDGSYPGPDIGDSWTEINTINYGAIEAIAVSDTCKVGFTGSSRGSTCVANGTYTGTNFYVQVDVIEADTDDNTITLLIRVQDIDNYYALRFSGDTFQLYKNVADVQTTLGSDQGAIVSNGDTVKLEITGTTLKAYVNDVVKQTETVTDHSSAGKAGLALGGIGGTDFATDDSANQELDNFEVGIASVAKTVTAKGDIKHFDFPQTITAKGKHYDVVERFIDTTYKDIGATTAYWDVTRPGIVRSPKQGEALP